jgi:AraC-like DNA-binding protein
MLDEILSSVDVQVFVARDVLLGTEWKSDNASDMYGRLYYIVSGKAHMWVKGKYYPLLKGFFYLIPSHAVHSLRCDKRVRIEYIHFTAMLPGGMDLFSYLNTEYQVKPEEPQFIRQLLKRMRTYWDKKVKVLEEPFETRGTLLQLLAPFVKQSSHSLASKERSIFLRFKPVLDTIQNNLHHPLTIPELASRIHLEPSYFTRLFTLHFGLSPIRYILRQRIRRAQMLLIQTDQTIEAIGLSLGFSDAFHFSKTFRKIANISPSEYRKKKFITTP